MGYLEWKEAGRGIAPREPLAYETMAHLVLPAKMKKSGGGDVNCTILRVMIYMRSIITEDKIRSLVNAGLSVRKIASAMGVCQQTVIRALRRYGLKTIVIRAHPNLNVRYFETIDSKEKAYWLGFLYADGCVKVKGGSLGLVLELATKDEETIDRFCAAVRADTKRKTYTTRLEKYYAVSIRFSGEFVRHLISQGCTPNKTFRIRFPHFDNEELDLAFLLGFYDGDGSVGGSIVCGNYAFLSDIANRYGIQDKLAMKGRLPTLRLSLELRKAMFTNYADSMQRKRATYVKRPYVRPIGVKPITELHNTVWPSDEELAKLVWQKPFTALCNDLNLDAPNTIKKRCIRRDIPRPPRGYWRRRNAGYNHEEALMSQKQIRTPQRRISLDQLAQAIQIIDSGKSIRSAARAIGFHHSTLLNILAKGRSDL
jgi:transposase-like protein